MYTHWHNYQDIQKISCKSYQNLFSKISDWYVLQKWAWLKSVTKDNRKHVVSTIITNKSKQLTFLGYQKSDQQSKKKHIQKFGFRVAFQTSPILKNILCKNKDNTK